MTLTKARLSRETNYLVSGYLDGDMIHVIVNHWPSRSGGEARSRKEAYGSGRIKQKDHRQPPKRRPLC